MPSRSPLQGYNHNIRYGSRVYHVQTEDSGLERPHLYTHLYNEGVIIASARTEYAELAQEPGHEPKVRKMMQRQHKKLMKQLRSGAFDDKIAALLGPAAESAAAEPAAAEPVAPEPIAPEPVAPEPIAPEPIAPEPIAPEPIAAEPAAPEPPPSASSPDPRRPLMPIASELLRLDDTHEEVASGIESAFAQAESRARESAEGRSAPPAPPPPAASSAARPAVPTPPHARRRVQTPRPEPIAKSASPAPPPPAAQAPGESASDVAATHERPPRPAQKPGVYMAPGSPEGQQPSGSAQPPRPGSTPQRYTAPSGRPGRPRRITGSYASQGPASTPPPATTPAPRSLAARSAPSGVYQITASGARPVTAPPQVLKQGQGTPSDRRVAEGTLPAGGRSTAARPPGQPPPARRQPAVVARPAVIINRGAKPAPAPSRQVISGLSTPTTQPRAAKPGRSPKAPAASEPPPQSPPAARPAPRGAADLFGSNVVSERSLDEVILQYLSEDGEAPEK